MDKYKQVELFHQHLEIAKEIIESRALTKTLAGLEFKIGYRFVQFKDDALMQSMTRQDAIKLVFMHFYDIAKGIRSAFKDDKESFIKATCDLASEYTDYFYMYLVVRKNINEPILLPPVLKASKLIQKNIFNIENFHISNVQLFNTESADFKERIFLYLKMKLNENKQFRVGFTGDTDCLKNVRKHLPFTINKVRVNNLGLKLKKITDDKNAKTIKNYDLCYGNINIRFTYMNYAENEDGYMIPIGRYGYDLNGDAKNIRGDISNIYGTIHPDLYGDVSGLVGDITNLYGCATGKKARIFDPLNKPTDIDRLPCDELDKTFKLLSNQDNITLMKVWNTFAHHTIGVTEEERKLFDKPVKVKPPFQVDKWGRFYKTYNRNDEYLVVYSVNPADIMFAKDVNKCSTCFCLNSGAYKWNYGMRCLIALNSVNPNIGVAYLIRKDSIKKLNQFEGIKFKWYDPEKATFFQYNDKDIWFWDAHLGLNIFTDNKRPAGVLPIYGHDGINKGHARQAKLAYLETFIKDTYRWNKFNKEFPLTTNNRDYAEDEVPAEWKPQIELANQKAKELKEYLEQMKE